jgi:hypothetical protein
MIQDTSIDSITEATLQALVDQQEPESKILDYKVMLNLNEEGAKAEFRRDITSFANSSGGDVIVGIRDNRGIPEALIGFDLGSASEEQYRLQIIEILQSRIKPRIQGIFVRLLRLSSSKWAAIIRIPQSLARPHQVEINHKDFQFWFRHEGSKQRMDIDELRSSILFSEALSERIRTFRIERLGRIMSGETPVALLKGTRIVLHLIPISAFSSIITYDLSPITHKAGLLNPIYSSIQDGFRYNFDGYFVHDQSPHESTAASYVQVFTNGIVESVEGRLFSYSGGKTIDSERFENLVITSVGRYKDLQKQLGVAPPTLILLSLLEINGYNLTVAHDTYRHDPRRFIVEQNLLVPEIVMNDYELQPDQILKPALDRIWNAAGWPRSPYYDEQGKRKNR